MIARTSSNCAWLREAGCRGVVALAQEGLVELAVIGPASPAQVTAAHELDDVVVVDDGSNAEMFFDCLALKRMMIVKAGLAALCLRRAHGWQPADRTTLPPKICDFRNMPLLWCSGDR